MPYIREVCVAGKTIEVSKYYSIRHHGKGEKREKRDTPSSEAMKKINQRRAGTKLRRLMNANFKDGDYLVRLDFSNRPAGSEEMQEIMAKFMRKLKRELIKKGIELKYIYVKEVGKRGSRHIHLMMNKCDLDIIRKYWESGGIHIDPLFTKGQYGKIAEYFIKYASTTEATEGQLIGKRWYGSRNLKKPKVTKKVISANKFRKDAKSIKGYALDTESIRSGFSEFTGHEYFSYTLIKTDKEGGGG